jgi:hypothetical protein
MGLLDSFKSALGLGGGGELLVQVLPERLHVGGRIEGGVTLEAKQPLKIEHVWLELGHTYPDYDGVTRETLDVLELDARVFFEAGQRHRWDFFFDVPWGVAPAIKPFGWDLVARAVLAGGQTLQREHVLPLRMAPVMEAVVGLIQGQFGFRMVEFGAEEDHQWISFEPQGAVRQHFHGLVVAWAEEAEGTTLWVDLRSFRPSALRAFKRDYNAHTNEIELRLRRRDHTIGHQADLERLKHVLEPLFALT